MNYYLKELSKYLIEESNILTSNKETELRMCLTDLPPKEIMYILENLNEELDKNSLDIERVYRVSTGLYKKWTKDEEKLLLDKFTNNNWLDLEDKLTYYRNKQAKVNKKLLIILIGVNYATDQGGLADFLCIEQKLIWDIAMKQSYSSWCKKIIDGTGLEFQSGEKKQLLSLFFDTLFNLFPRDLFRLGLFINNIVYNSNGSIKLFDSMEELLADFYEALPFWGIPPLFNLKGTEKIYKDTLKKAFDFANRQGFFSIESARIKKYIKKIELFKESDKYKSFELPENYVGEVDEYFDDLENYLKNSNYSAKKKLLVADLKPLFDILEITDSKPSKKNKPKIFNTSPIVAILNGIFYSLSDKENQHNTNSISEVNIRIKQFIHPYKDNENDILAKDLLKFCYKGLDEYLESLSLNLNNDINISFEIDFNDISYKYKASNSHVLFTVNLDNKNSKKYKWNLGENKDELILFEKIKLIKEKLDKDNFIPYFNLSKVYNEIFFVNDASEANRLFRLGLDKFEIKKALHIDDYNDSDFKNLIRELQIKYYNFISKSLENGWYSSIKNNLSPILDSYKNLVNKTLETDSTESNKILYRLYKAFLIIPENIEPKQMFLKSAILTGISPAVCEIIQAQNAFLISSFQDIIKECFKNKLSQKEGLKKLEHCFNLIDINRPLVGLIDNEDKRVSTQLRSFGLIHCLGTPAKEELSVLSKSMMREDKECEISSSTLFNNSPVSNIYKKVIFDLNEIKKHIKDSISIMVININNIQPIIAALQEFLEKIILLDCDDGLPQYTIFIKVYYKDTSPQIIEGMLSEWKMWWNERESKRKININLGISNILDISTLIEQLKNEVYDYDICFISQFMETNKSGDEIKTSEDLSLTSTDYKFPISELPRPTNDMEQDNRKILLSNRRFDISSLHTQLSAKIRNGNYKNAIIEGNATFSTEWKNILDLMHIKSEWTACIDPYFDRKILERKQERRIIGSSCGLGLNGEFNLTVSTEKDTVNKILTRVGKAIKSIYIDWKEDDISSISQQVFKEVDKMIGLSLLNITTKNEFVRNVIAYAAVSKVIKQNKKENSVEIIIPLDSFTHWFESENNRPDLLSLSIEQNCEKKISINATVIECKLAKKNEKYSSKAMMQVEAGIERLSKIFTPSIQDKDSLNYDSRYWWNQLYRVIATQADVTDEQLTSFQFGLELLAEGIFDITWSGATTLFWTDIETNIEKNVINYYNKEISLNKSSLKVAKLEISSTELKDIFLNDNNKVSIDSDSRVSFEADNMQRKLAEQEVAKCAEQEVAKRAEQEVAKCAEQEVAKCAEIPDRILLGTDKNKKSIYWEYGHKELNNRHIIIFGRSGTGKTYAIQSLLYEMSKFKQNSLIVDYTQGFLPGQLEEKLKTELKPRTEAVIHSPLSINPFKPLEIIIDPSIPPIIDKPEVIGGRVASVFSSVYSNIGEQQFALLARIISEGISNYSNQFDLNLLLASLEQEESDTSKSLLAKITPFVKMNVFKHEKNSSWERYFSNKELLLNIIQLAGVPQEIQKLIIELVLWDLYNYATTNGNKNKPLPIVLDEIQNLDHRLSSPLAKILTEGRKFGFSLILATQTLSNLPKDAQDRLFQASHKLFFAPAETEIKTYSEILTNAITGSDKKEWIMRLTQLTKGQCISVGPALQEDNSVKNKAHIVNITSFEER